MMGVCKGAGCSRGGKVGLEHQGNMAVMGVWKGAGCSRGGEVGLGH